MESGNLKSHSLNTYTEKFKRLRITVYSILYLQYAICVTADIKLCSRC